MGLISVYLKYRIYVFVYFYFYISMFKYKNNDTLRSWKAQVIWKNKKIKNKRCTQKKFKNWSNA